ncbi:MAG: GDP-mannose 4,6-dehydratase [Planctomycetaceae bacterium]|nr:GDP-mannose 4,6-dehydratase [Planctomycetaceae bacterium]
MTETTAPRPRRAFITGVTGQDGSYLAELLLQKGYEVAGMVRRSSTAHTSRIEHLLADRNLQSRFRLIEGDLADGASLMHALKAVEPDEIYNLAAQSHVGVSFEMPGYTADVTGVGVVRLLQAIRDLGITPRFYQASSSEIFGRAESNPQYEQTPLSPCNPYGAAKAMAFYMTRIYREGYGLFAVNGILFNHESPRRGETFVTRKITRAVAEIVAGRRDQVLLGNLEARRDWGFAGDYVEAMWLMLQADVPQDYVIATGETHSVREFCELAFAHVGLPLTWKGEGLSAQGLDPQGRVVVAVDPRFFRPSDIDCLQGDSSMARSELGWKPQVTFEALVRMMVDADLQKVRAEGA